MCSRRKFILLLRKLDHGVIYITTNRMRNIHALFQLRLAMQEDDELALLKHINTQGWPSNIKEVPNMLQPYWTFREELTIEDGLVLKGTRIDIPNKKH